MEIRFILMNVHPYHNIVWMSIYKALLIFLFHEFISFTWDIYRTAILSRPGQ